MSALTAKLLKEKRLEDLPPGSLQACEPELGADGIGLRGTAGAAAGGRCVVPRGAAQEGLYRRREAGDRTGGHPACGAADVSDGGSGARGVRRGESAVDRSVNFEEMRCFMESKTRMAGTDTAMGSRSTFRRT